MGKSVIFAIKNIRRMAVALSMCLCSVLAVLAADDGGDYDVMPPVVNADHSVTFTIEAPDAQVVKIEGDFLPKVKKIRTKAGTFGRDQSIEMTKKGKRWTYTSAVLASNFYTYNFVVDGVRTLDPRNTNVVRDVNELSNYFIVDGGIADSYLPADVPHGSVEQVWYPSSWKGMKRRRMTVYTPPTYATSAATTRFPVLYLLHGSGGDETSWCDCGRAVQILDNLIAKGLVKPMIVVMPNGLVDWQAAPGIGPDYNREPTANNVSSMMGLFENTFVADVVTYVDSHYRTLRRQSGRAIAGLSLGGLHAIHISANKPSTFGYVGLFSAQTTNALNNRVLNRLGKVASRLQKIVDKIPNLQGSDTDHKVDDLNDRFASGDMDVYSNIDSKLKTQFASGLKLYYIAVGRDDFVKKLNDDFRQKLDDAGCTYVYNETDGGHSWDNWRKYLVDFLPRLFK